MGEPLTLRTPARHWPPWALALAATGALLLAISVLSEAGAFGHGPAASTIGDVSYLMLTGGAAVVGLAAAWSRRDLAGWGLVGLALLANAGGDLYYQFGVDAIEGPYPSVADLLYFAFYALVILGLRNLARQGGYDRIPIAALLTPLLGLAALWSAVVFGPVVGTLEGSTAARMTTLAYPFLDLLTICAAILALAANGWRLGRSMLLLVAGMITIGIADSVFAVQVAAGAFAEQTVIDSLWPLGMILIAIAPWLAPTRGGGGDKGSRVELALAVPSVVGAAAILIVDHFSRLHAVTVALAALTMVAAAARLVALYHEAEEARTERGRMENLHTASTNAALEAIITVDREGKVVDWNPAATRIFGYAASEALGREIGELSVPASIRDEYERAFESFASGHSPHLIGRRIEMKGRRKDGTELPAELTIARVSDDPPLFTAFVADVTERKHREMERDRLAQMVRSAEDAMYSTNRDHIVIAWNPAAERIFGYPAEQIVGTKAERLVPADRRDELMRLDETVAAGETISVETKRLRADGEFLDVALQVHPVRDELGRVVGYASVARDITDRRRIEREQRLHAERAAWQGQVEDALETDSFEFFRQPVLDLADGTIRHHELLLRMRLDDEIVLPGRFLPFAESSPQLMRRIDRWAIRRGIELASERPVAINLSARSLSDAGIAKAVQRALDETGADPRDVTFEITETAAAEQLEDAHALVAALSSLGCGVALDDFGTGYGSFTYLLRMPVTSLKIDMEFIRALSEDPADQRVVGSILAVAKNFGLTTVAEGVEEESTLRLLRRMGVDAVQGYLVGRPQPDWTGPGDLSEALGSAGER